MASGETRELFGLLYNKEDPQYSGTLKDENNILQREIQIYYSIEILHYSTEIQASWNSQGNLSFVTFKNVRTFARMHVHKMT